PQFEENQNIWNIHDPVVDDLNLSMEEPAEKEYKFFYGNGQLHVSPEHDHDQLREHAGVQPGHEGPMAVGYVSLQGKNALWSVESNIGLRRLVKEMKD